MFLFLSILIWIALDFYTIFYFLYLTVFREICLGVNGPWDCWEGPQPRLMSAGFQMVAQWRGTPSVRFLGGRGSTQRKNLLIVVHHWNKDPNLPPFHHQLSPPSIKNKQPSHQTPRLPLPPPPPHTRRLRRPICRSVRSDRATVAAPLLLHLGSENGRRLLLIWGLHWWWWRRWRAEEAEWWEMSRGV